MDSLLRRHFWVVDLIGIAVAAAFAGHAAAQLMASALPASRQVPHVRTQRSRPVSVAAADKSIDGIVGRNLFCSTCDGIPLPERSRRPLTLLAIMYAPPPSDPHWSVAIVRDEEAAATGPYGVGARLSDATIEAIEEVRVVLDVGGGRREFLELLRRRPPGPSARGGAPVDALTDGVRKTGTYTYEVRRAVLERFLSGGGTPPFPRVVPQMRDGEPAGIRLLGVRPDSPFAAIGLVSGDLLMKANGRSIATPDAALAAYAELRTARHVWLTILRDGQSIRFDYNLIER